ncbi:ABC transporter ATP-binding protein [Peptostreptococcus anaerobius]|uniref:ABC transporter ATP-binding protein n=1 Tax=Peptostreptococcus anaerobius TaxID=1261 RepID=UPI00232A7B9F|nr:ABC transporter ATP-binding protein [Peptostreptococcus anaerobius]HEN4571337.1 ABC transporter ATP-binding protein [Streptococcus agalactiae]MDB8850522.1 ABC transporter ATP-binding protein [Peptostreptococcus anaerobius]MDB8854226.1 ABC transporter ATP-binding protein [Peptostreptococcus anaerobius]MDB8856090.1 ABC transporter ATP-binding protein [Peptostreptococcus anaerobius]HEN4572921.1 ABC transporter ATP-binding protein [Streptococcus agalactiae]
MFEIVDLKKKYGNKKAIDGISFDLHGGELCGFVGGNGAGKSTLIKIATGVIGFDSGNVILDGISIKDKPVDFKKYISYVPDIPYMYDYMSPKAFWNFILDVYDVDCLIGEETVKRYIELFDMYGYIDQPISSLSKGMRQKVALVSAFIHPAKVYIFDEPFSGLDPKSILILKNILKEKIDNKCCILFSTHLLDVAEKICNRIIAIKEGKIISDETCICSERKGYDSLEKHLIGMMYDE